MSYASIGEDIDVAKTVILALLGIAYTVYHVVLIRKGHSVAKAVWCVCALYAASVAANLFTIVLDVMEKTIQEGPLCSFRVRFLRCVCVCVLTTS